MNGSNQCNYLDMNANGLAALMNAYSLTDSGSQAKSMRRKTDDLEQSGDLLRQSHSLVETMQDSSLEYYHIMVASQEDQCSHAIFNDVLEFNHLLKTVGRYYKTYNIQYMSKSNEKLKS